ncbi:MAG: hypothetical protein JWN30_1899, partial [Bacilli bacterium]|nr:hypothetical protein [Bacilli bacterium]
NISFQVDFTKLVLRDIHMKIRYSTWDEFYTAIQVQELINYEARHCNIRQHLC